LKIYSPHVLSLTLVDLPGLTKVGLLSLLWCRHRTHFGIIDRHRRPARGHRKADPEPDL
jgi:hypothetical protein